MNDVFYQYIHEYMQEILYIKEPEELEKVTFVYESNISAKADMSEEMASKLWQDAKNVASVLACLRAGSVGQASAVKTDGLSGQEIAELAETEGIIKGNRMTYHFQPIVNVEDGEIYSYEALMRPRSDMALSPLHIIKYAEIAGRLNDIELATFMNVLGIIDSHKELFLGRKVFINSIPKAYLSAGDFIRVDELLSRNSDTVVVEITEQTEFDEASFREMKERYRRMNIKIAIDDYGTGYSNIKNLLRYTPDYVKIDHSLLSNIQNSAKKRHFVREIIEFCHDNGIKALAEGVETEEELHCVILLGADLVQGFYTARPSADILESIPAGIKQQIKLFREERQDGVDQHIYYAEDSERIQLDRLVKNGFTCITAGKEHCSGDFAVIGSPALDTEIHIVVQDGFSGHITLENVHLSNVKGRPCIDIGENCNVTIVINGENIFRKTGIRVPDGSELTVEGEGMLRIYLKNSEYYGIGNDLEAKHGTLNFRQRELIMIEAAGKKGVCIGSGRGGPINIFRGQYVIEANGELGVGIGAFYGKNKLFIDNCDFNAEMSVTKGVAIGSLDRSTDVLISHSSAKLYLSGREFAAIGTVSGESSDIKIKDANVLVNLQSDRCTAAGALNGCTDFSVCNATYRVMAGGEKMLPFGGFIGETHVSLTDADTSIRVETTTDFRDFISEENIRIVNGRTLFMLNGYEKELKTEKAD